MKSIEVLVLISQDWDFTQHGSNTLIKQNTWEALVLDKN